MVSLATLLSWAAFGYPVLLVALLVSVMAWGLAIVLWKRETWPE